MSGYKRTEDQRIQDRKRIAELRLTGHTYAEIAEIIGDERGYSLSPSQARYDMQVVRKSWLKGADVDYDTLINQELDRLDALEASLWKDLRESATPIVRRTVEKWIRASNEVLDEDEIERFADKITEVTTSTKRDAAIYGHIIRVQQERRKIRGLYAPELRQIRQEVIVKGYAKVSPSDWDDDDDIVEGETVVVNDNHKQLGNGEDD